MLTNHKFKNDNFTKPDSRFPFQVEIEYGSYFAELKTNSHLSLLYKKHCNELGLKFLKEEQNLPVGIATDMGNVSFVTPSIHVLYDINTAALNNTKEFALAAGKPSVILYPCHVMIGYKTVHNS